MISAGKEGNLNLPLLAPSFYDDQSATFCYSTIYMARVFHSILKIRFVQIFIRSFIRGQDTGYVSYSNVSNLIEQHWLHTFFKIFILKLLTTIRTDNETVFNSRFAYYNCLCEAILRSYQT